ncbi:MAG: site-specific tyrosine recombinase XerD [Pseudomonadota bacterium]
MNTEHVIAGFLDALRAERDAAKNTLEAYARDLSDCAAFCARSSRDLLTADRPLLEAYLMELDQIGLSQSTRARRLSALKQFYRFLHSEGIREDNPTDRMRGPSPKQKLPTTLSEDAVDRLLIAATKTGRSEADRLRNTCLMELLYATGLRVSELVSLPVASFRASPQTILVRGKGGKERMVPLSQPALTAIAHWLPLRDELPLAKTQPAARFLFPSRGKLGHMTRVRFFGLLKDIAVQAGLDPSTISPHTLRHAFATHLLANGADLRAIQMLLGHADVATTEIYTHILDERLKALVLEHHPLAQD